MRQHRLRQLGYGVTTGVFIFGVLWLLAAILVSESTLRGVPAWQTSLSLVVELHTVDIRVAAGRLGGGVKDTGALFGNVSVILLRLTPPVMLAIGSFYAAWRISDTRSLWATIGNAATILWGYLPMLLVAAVVSEPTPPIETLASVKTLISVGPAVGLMAAGVGVAGLGMFLSRGRWSIRSAARRHVGVLVILILLGGGLYVAVGGPTPDATLPDRNSTPTGTETGSENGTADPSEPSEIDERMVATQILQLVNAERQQRGLSTLSPSAQLAGPARDHAADMAARDYLGHTSPDGVGTSQRYPCAAVGENILQTWVFASVGTANGTYYHTNASQLAAGIVEGWLTSPPHRENIFDPAWSTAGVGVTIREGGKTFAAMAYCE